jgi:hypothetical protein
MQPYQPDAFVADTDPILIQFLHDKLHTLVQWDVLQFFHHNPHTMDTPGQIARALGRERESVAVAMLALHDARLLQSRNVGETIYMLTDDTATRAIIERFMQACDNPRFRRGVISTLAQKPVFAR